MKIYDLIADNYERIFPLEKEKIDFIQKLIPPPAKIFDAGCATGELALALYTAGYSVYGVDLNTAMITRAEQAASLRHTQMQAAENTVEFYSEDMRSVRTQKNLSAVLCFGNTLVHLPNRDEVSAFFTSVYESLNPEGFFIFQILNYDKILAEKRVSFQIKEDTNFIFKRRYEFPPGEKVDFIIEFTDKNTEKTQSDSTPLLPLQKKDLYLFLENAGFKNIRSYSDYKGTKSDLSEFATVYTAQK